MITVKVRTSDGEVASLQVAEDGDGLFLLVAEELGLDQDSFDLLGGFPPRPLDSQGAKNARQLGVQNNDLLILRMKQEAVGVAQATGKVRVRTKRNKNRDEQVGKSKEDVSEKLIKAFTAGPKDNVSTFLRKAARQAVVSQYEIRAGNDRYKSALASSFKINKKSLSSSGTTLGGDEATIEYPKGSRGAKATDEVKLLSRDALNATLRYILAIDDEEQRTRVQELVRPAKMAEVSPAAFWSLVNICGGGADLEAGLEQVAPEIDWGFLESRRRTKSDKARQAEENARILEEEKKERKRLAEERKRKREAKSPATVKKQKDLAKVSLAQLKEAVDGNVKVVKALEKIGVKSVQDASNLDQDKFVSTVSSVNGMDAESAVQLFDQVRQTAVQAMFGEIVEQENYIEKLQSEHRMGTPFDLVKLRVPGRVEFIAEELGACKEVVRGWQRKAKQLVEDRPWLEGYRTAG